MNVTYDKPELFEDSCFYGGFAGEDLRFKTTKSHPAGPEATSIRVRHQKKPDRQGIHIPP